jgi:hypothetical protein
MMKNFDDFQKIGQTNVDATMKMLGEWSKGWQAIATEMSDYTKRSFEDGTKTFEKLASARSLEQVMEIQSSYAKRAYDDYVAQMTRLGSMYADLAKGSVKPFEQFGQARR